MDRSDPRDKREKVPSRGKEPVECKKRKRKKTSIGNSKRISYRNKKKPKIEQENKGKMLDTFRESQEKYGSHLVEPLG